MAGFPIFELKEDEKQQLMYRTIPKQTEWIHNIFLPAITITDNFGHQRIGSYFGYQVFPATTFKQCPVLSTYITPNMEWLCLIKRFLLYLCISESSLGSISITLGFFKS